MKTTVTYGSTGGTTEVEVSNSVDEIVRVLNSGDKWISLDRTDGTSFALRVEYVRGADGETYTGYNDDRDDR